MPKKKPRFWCAKGTESCMGRGIDHRCKRSVPIKRKEHRGKHAQLVRANDPKPTMFTFRIKMTFFTQPGEDLKNSDVGRRLHELMTENDMTFDYDDLVIDVKNDTDRHWDEPWLDEKGPNED